MEFCGRHYMQINRAMTVLGNLQVIQQDVHYHSRTSTKKIRNFPNPITIFSLVHANIYAQLY